MKTAPKKASIRQVAATIFFALIAIGKKGTWQKDGATVTMFQIVVGAAIGFVVIVSALILLVHLVAK